MLDFNISSQSSSINNNQTHSNFNNQQHLSVPGNQRNNTSNILRSFAGSSTSRINNFTNNSNQNNNNNKDKGKNTYWNKNKQMG